VARNRFQIHTSAALIILGTRGVSNQHGGFEALAEHLFDSCTSMGIECLVIGNRDLDVASTLMGRITRYLKEPFWRAPDQGKVLLSIKFAKCSMSISA
jgi:hypothetical protein